MINLILPFIVLFCVMVLFGLLSINLQCQHALFLCYYKNATRGIEKMISEAVQRSSTDDAKTCSQSKRKVSQLPGVKHE